MVAPGTVQIGGWEFPPPGLGGGVAIVRPRSAAKFDEKESEGKDDAETNYKGRLPAKFDVEFRWKSRFTSVDDYAVRMLKDISPRGPNAGKPWEFVAADQEIHNAFSIEVKELDGPIRVPGNDEVTAKISCGSWVKPKKRPLVAKKPDKPKPWSPTSKDPPPVNLVPDPPGGFSDANTAPQVTP